MRLDCRSYFYFSTQLKSNCHSKNSLTSADFNLNFERGTIHKFHDLSENIQVHPKIIFLGRKKTNILAINIIDKFPPTNLRTFFILLPRACLNSERRWTEVKVKIRQPRPKVIPIDFLSRLSAGARGYFSADRKGEGREFIVLRPFYCTEFFLLLFFHFFPIRILTLWTC